MNPCLKKIFLKSLFCLALIFSVYVPAQAQKKQAKGVKSYNTVLNFDEAGNQLTRFSTLGDAIDAHDGEIALFDGVYYLYGTSYDCGFEWRNKNAPFCGFKTYTSTDLVNWTDRGFLFDAKTQIWQTRCDGNTIGCFRPHVIYNKKTKFYVLWINVYDNVSGYRVFTSKGPIGPFVEQAEPKLAVNSAAVAGGLNDGDHDTFVDDDGTAYLAYTDWKKGGSIVIEKLSPDYLSGTGKFVESVTSGKTEAPGMFKRKGIYYVVYSDPNCGYCSGTGASYRTAKSALGPWSRGKKISDNSCGGQPSFVSTIKLKSGTVYLFGSDLWNNAAKNEALANYYWAPLSFAADGSIIPMTCDHSFKIVSEARKPRLIAKPPYLRMQCDIGRNIQRAVLFNTDVSGKIDSIHFTTFKTGNPDSALLIEIYNTDSLGHISGQPLDLQTLPTDAVGWSAKRFLVRFNVNIKKNNFYSIVLKSNSRSGCYGFAYKEHLKDDSPCLYSKDGGITFSTQSEKTLDVSVNISVATRID